MKKFKRIVISDSHWGISRSNTPDWFDFAAHIVPMATDEVILNGDIFDLQVSGAIDSIRSGWPWISAVITNLNVDATLTINSGNHDSRIGEIMPRGPDSEKIRFESGALRRGKATILHGEILDRRFMKYYTFLDKTNFMGGGFTEKVVTFFTSRFVVASKQKNLNPFRKEQKIYAEKNLAPGDYLINGHSHSAAKFVHEEVTIIDSGGGPDNEITFAAESFDSSWDLYRLRDWMSTFG